MAGKEKLESYSPKMVHAGDFPVVTDSGTVASGETIHELMPITLGLRTKTSYARSYRTEVKRNFRSRTLQNLYWSQSFLLTLWVCISVSK